MIFNISIDTFISEIIIVVFQCASMSLVSLDLSYDNIYFSYPFQTIGLILCLSQETFVIEKFKSSTSLKDYSILI